MNEQIDSPPRPTLAALFFCFLRFGLLAWGGPVAQIAMLRQELVERERWITGDRFNRVLAVYQVLPGPEATELCCYFGMISRGRIGSLLAGLGFVLPGFVVMLVISWAYFELHLGPGGGARDGGTWWWIGISMAMQAAVASLVLRGAAKIGEHAITSVPLAMIAVASAVLEALGVPFWMTLPVAAVAALRRDRIYAGLITGAALAGAIAWQSLIVRPSLLPKAVLESDVGIPIMQPTVLYLLLSGLKAGLLTFGGAYTAIPFVRRDAVTGAVPNHVGWMVSGQFYDGLALAGMIPAPLVMFTTFVGYAGGGFAGAAAMTLGVFAPAFGFTLFGHGQLERLVDNTRFHAVLDAVTAAVVGIIAVLAWHMMRTALTTPLGAAIVLASTAALVLLKGRWLTPTVILGAAIAGFFKATVLAY